MLAVTVVTIGKSQPVNSRSSEVNALAENVASIVFERKIEIFIVRRAG